jgi:hypothetical protein
VLQRLGDGGAAHVREVRQCEVHGIPFEGR